MDRIYSRDAKGDDTCSSYGTTIYWVNCNATHVIA